jgi:linoleoyl-CoA desaturase
MHRTEAADRALLHELYAAVQSEVPQHRLRFALALTAKFAVYAGLTVASYVILLRTESELGAVLAYVAYGMSVLLLAFNFSHDFAHDTVFANKTWNDRLFIILYAVLGAHGQAWKHRHVAEHHFAPNVDGYDSDLKITSLIRVQPESPLKPYHRFQVVYAPFAYLTYSVFWIFIKDFVLLYAHDPQSSKGWSYHAAFWAQKSLYVAVSLGIPLAFGSAPATSLILGYLAMHATQSIFLIFTFFMTHHVEGTSYPEKASDGSIESSWVMNQILSSNDIHPHSRAANFVLGGFNNHIAHHLFPHIHHVYYPKITRVVYRILNQHGIRTNHTTYLGGVVAHLKHLYVMGRTPHP